MLNDELLKTIVNLIIKNLIIWGITKKFTLIVAN